MQLEIIILNEISPFRKKNAMLSYIEATKERYERKGGCLGRLLD